MIHIHQSNTYKRKDEINMLNADIGALLSYLSIILCHKDKDEVNEKMETAFEANEFAEEHPDIAPRSIMKTTPGLLNAFRDGYHDTINKYGIDEGIEIVKNKIIQVVLGTGYYKSEKDIIMTAKQCYLMADLAAMGGIHIDNTGGDNND